MWRTPRGNRTLTGPMAVLIAEGISSIAQQLRDMYELGGEDELEYGMEAFDDLTSEQKVWTLHKVGFGLLSEDTPVVPHTAALEATIMVVFLETICNIEIEIDIERLGDREHDWQWNRKRLLNAYEQTGLNDPENLEDDEEPLTAGSMDIQDWKNALDCLEDDIFWDHDFAMSFADLPPEAAKAAREQMTIDEDYYSVIPDDPQPEAAKRLLSELMALCDHVIQQEAESTSSGDDAQPE